MANRKLIVEIAGDSRSLERALKKSGSAVDSFGKRMRKVLTGRGFRTGLKIGGIGALATGGGLVGTALFGGVSAFKASAEFEATMSRIQGLAGQSANQVAKWSNQLIALGPAIGKTPQELAEALYFIASSGVPASKALNTLAVSARAAEAGLGETQVVADAVTSVMNAYASSGMTAAHATDILVATVREGKGEADEFAGTIGNVAAFASKLHVPFEQVGAALAAMTQLGTDPRTAATQLQALFSQILKVSSPMQKKAEKMGLPDLFDQLQQKLTSGNLLGALRQLKNLGPIELSNLFPNVRAVRASLALVGPVGGRVAQIFRRMAHSTGSASKSFAAYAKTSKHHMEQLHSSIEALKIAFGQGLAPVVSQVAQSLAKKFADPKFVARVRRLGFLIGNFLLQAFTKIKEWWDRNGPTILRYLNGLAGAIGKIVKATGWMEKHKGPSGLDILHKVAGAPGILAHGLGHVGGDVHVHGNVVVHSDDPKKLTEHIVREAKKKAPRTRGRGHPHPHFG